MKKKNTKALGIVLLILLNVVVIAATALSEFSDSKNAEDVTKIKIRAIYLLPALLAALAAIAVETLKYARLMKKTCGYFRIGVCLKTVLFGRYYDNITPSGIGGQPYQIYYMNKNGVPSAAAAAVPLSGFMSMQFGFVLLALGCFFFGGHTMQSDFTRIVGYFGLFMYAFFPTFIILFTIFPKFSSRLLSGGVSLLHRLHIVKDKEKTVEKTRQLVDEYVECNKTILKAPGTACEILVYGILYQALVMAIPYFVIRAFGGDLDFFQCFCTTVSIYATVTFIPTPGNMGAAEGTFYAVFSSVSEGLIFWAMLIWRFLTCYGFMLVGIILYIARAMTHGAAERESFSDKAEKPGGSSEVGTEH